MNKNTVKGFVLGMVATMSIGVGISAVAAEGFFKDVKEGAWYTTNIEWAKDMGLMQGTGDDQFQPDKALTRAEMATVLRNLYENGYFAKDVEENTVNEEPAQDQVKEEQPANDQVTEEEQGTDEQVDEEQPADQTVTEEQPDSTVTEEQADSTVTEEQATDEQPAATDEAATETQATQQ
ncbi:S-layer homology domain-containing protein [Ammoniphilus resinae]|uniref:FtsZ-interacting cell division protein ZipA n=1 Tax=Ammoniphilus resinae TaxID=861532 RepID=A0ABS4GQN3_9BACL|nr:S-layer homology domain-containing protein [Ammoniphilus resinae]MBP1932544.1 FtsZ-interacting cell division protein ZipA [Ammoniphilus resinae]